MTIHQLKDYLSKDIKLLEKEIKKALESNPNNTTDVTFHYLVSRKNIFKELIQLISKPTKKC